MNGNCHFEIDCVASMTENKMVRKSLEDGIDLFGSLEFRSIGVDGSFTDVAFHVQNLIQRDPVLAFAYLNVQVFLC